MFTLYVQSSDAATYCLSADYEAGRASTTCCAVIATGLGCGTGTLRCNNGQICGAAAEAIFGTAYYCKWSEGANCYQKSTTTTATKLTQIWGCNAGCLNIQQCANKVANSEYLTGVDNRVAACAFGCNAGYVFNALSGLCDACGANTFSAFNAASCTDCVKGVHYPLANSYVSNSTGNANGCDWGCDAGYFKNSTSMTCNLCDPCNANDFNVGCGGTSAGVCTPCELCTQTGYYRANCTGPNPGSCAECVLKT